MKIIVAGYGFVGKAVATAIDNRIGSSHMHVPGPDGSRGFGGACFPKDTNAFVHYADTLSISNTLVESAIKYNKKIRKRS